MMLGLVDTCYFCKKNKWFVRKRAIHLGSIGVGMSQVKVCRKCKRSIERIA